MQELATTAAGFPVRLRWLRMGDDLCLVLSGGEQEHIGAVAAAQPRPSLVDPARTSATASVITLPGHKEDMLARELALKVAATLNVAVCVACGIHVRHPSPGMLDELVAASRGLVDAFLAEMQNTVNMKIHPTDKVRNKLQGLSITKNDIADAISFARQR